VSVLLGRLRIRGRLALLILVPLLAALVPTVVAAVGIGQQAARAASTANRVREASQVAKLVRALQLERLAAVGVLVGQVDHRELVLAEANTQDAASAVNQLGLPKVDTDHGQGGGGLPDLSLLPRLRGAVEFRQIRPLDLITAYTDIVSDQLDRLRLPDFVDGNTAQGNGAVALDGVLRGNEGFAAALASMVAGHTPDIADAYIAALDLVQQGALRFVAYATIDEAALYNIAQQAVNSRLGPDFNRAMALGGPAATIGILDHPPSYTTVVALTGVGEYIESKVINDTIAIADSAARQGETRVAVFVGLSVLLVLAAIAIGASVARSVAVPVRRLTRSAENVASLAESELVRVADDESDDPEPVRLRPIEATGRDELADLARAFVRVQRTAAQLVERQVAGRRNVALMFGHVGRRTQNLVSRQISLIDRLESRETAPERLGDLYRLDHMSSRLLRNASSLVVLSGGGDDDQHVAPTSLDEIVRIGLAQIEDYARVDVRTPTVHIGPALINDLVLLLAELMENATSFSPPGTRVVVSATLMAQGLRVGVIDQGIGMTPERLADENARFTRRERLDLAPTEVLGLFVVGRLARRHGLRVGLGETPGGGVTAIVDIPGRLLAETLAPLPGAPNGGGHPVSHSPREIAMLSRASVTMREGRPWNAFAAGSRPALVGRAAVPAIPRPRNEPAPLPAAPTSMSLAAPRGPGGFAGPSGPGGMRAHDARSSTLSRRVPGASLAALEGEAAGPRSVPLAAPSSADEVRDSLADFESGIARAMREVQQGDR
jgi:signal transduction histidine kinase